MKTHLIFIVLVVLTSCHRRQDKPVQQVAPPVAAQPINKPFHLIDSLNKYAGTDSLFVINGRLFYVGKANKKDFAVDLQNDSTIVFYQRDSANWIGTDTMRSVEYGYGFGFHGVSAKDLNGDGKEDVVVAHDISGSAGNTENFVFLFNTRRNKFVHNDYYDLTNVIYIAKSKMIGSSFFAGVMHPQEKMTYKITGDSLTFNEGVTLCEPQSMADTIQTLEFYKMKGDKRIVTKRICGNPEKLSDIFEKSYWVGEFGEE